MAAISVGQAAANALAAWFVTSFTSDVTVLSRWPVNGPALQNRTVSITKIGPRRRLDVSMPLTPQYTTRINRTTDRVAFPVGSYFQPIQIDIWCTSDADREDILSQLDDALTQGVDKTIDASLTDDPVKDGIVIPLLPDNGYVGYIDCWFDEPDIDDDPQSIQRSQFRATYAGDVRGTFYRFRQVPRLVSATMKTQSSEQSPAPAGTPYDTVTVTDFNDTGVITITHGQSSS